MQFYLFIYLFFDLPSQLCSTFLAGGYTHMIGTNARFNLQTGRVNRDEVPGMPLSEALNPQLLSGEQIRLWLYWEVSRCECVQLLSANRERKTSLNKYFFKWYLISGSYSEVGSLKPCTVPGFWSNGLLCGVGYRKMNTTTFRQNHTIRN